MDPRQLRLIEQRERGRRLLRRITGWSAAGALALAGVFGIALARHDRAAAAPASSVPDSGYQAPGTGGAGPGDSTGPGGGSVLQPPANPPVQHDGGGQHANSGGS
jgi:hypothetical protein